MQADLEFRYYLGQPQCTYITIKFFIAIAKGFIAIAMNC